MEWLPVGDLTKFLYSHTIEMSLKVSMSLQLVVGLSYLHSKKILHRDLKTQNLLLTSDYQLKISDFGCSKLTSGTATSNIVGTPIYLASEIVLESKPYTEKSDIYAVGIILWEIFENNPQPFSMYPNLTTLNALSMAIQIQTQNLRPIFETITEVNLQNLIYSLWDRDPNKRPELKAVSSFLNQYE